MGLVGVPGQARGADRPGQYRLAISQTGQTDGVEVAEMVKGVAFDAGAKRVLLPMASVGDIPTIPGELFAKFQTSFYSDPRDAAFKSLGVE